MGNIVFSIIIPHYNTLSTLKRCIESIPKREDVQIIIVDDCSPNQRIIQEYIDSIERKGIEFYITESNKGGGHARNNGLRYAKGKYIIFADADDFFNYCFNDILNEYKDKEFDITYFNANALNSETYLPVDRAYHVNALIEQYYASKDSNEDGLKYAFGEPWSKIIKRSLIDSNEISFEEIPLHNDTLFSYMVGFHAKVIMVDKRAGYCITDRDNSVSKQKSKECLIIRQHVFAKKNKFLKDNGINYFDKIFWWNFDYARKNNDKDLLNECLAVIENYGFSKEMVFERFNAIDRAERIEKRYQKRRKLINKIKSLF